ncbi:putative BsuMI modification methylase subunit YdiP [Anaeromyxobacter oryzae]|uniref:Cytosine-specific methyltransferase n=1 Tax=Anaeromyxobacter oryzae TaxID=2918170 RepID=A0ABM7WTM8_9BACT|nr:putative BsuMI modification methylase subunit YdiP [Anaeromyxobacter oryzae]
MKKARKLRVAGLFAGIGGLEEGLRRAHHETLLLCENDLAARAVLAAKFPHVKSRPKDVTKLNKLPRKTDLVAAGFPCQDLSQAGKTAGIAGARSGLVGQVFRLLGLKEDGTVAKTKHRPKFVLLENVPFMLQLARGEALNVIVTTLETLGYKWAYRVIDSRAFGVPQRRERVFLVATLATLPDEDPRDILFAEDAGEPGEPKETPRDVACGFYWTEGTRGLGWGVDCVPTLKGGSTIGIPSPPAIVMPEGRVVTPGIRDAERLQGFKRDWTKAAEAVARKSARWKLVGNAVTVHVAHWIGKQFANPGEYVPRGDVRLYDGAPWPRAAYNVGSGRFHANVSSWPVQRRRKPLAKFVKEATDLSEKAAAGFLKRARASKLKFEPWFLDTVEAHVDRVRAARSSAAA